MKKSIVIKAPKVRIKKDLKICNKTVLFYSMLICGVIIGCFAIKNCDKELVLFIDKIISNHICVKSNNGYISVFCSVFLCSILIFIYNYIMGLCGLGVVFISVSPVVLGIFCGMNITYHYLFNGIQGLVYCFIVNLPMYIITAATLIKCCCESYDCSLDIFKYLVDGKGSGKQILKLYSVKIIIYLVPLLIASVINTVIFKLTANLFSFIN